MKGNKKMKATQMSMVGLLGLFCATNIEAKEWVWPETGGTSPANALDYFNPGYWKDGVPGATDDASFENGQTGMKYVIADRPVSVKMLTGAAADGYSATWDCARQVVLMSDSLVSLAKVNRATLYANVTSLSSDGAGKGVLCGDVTNCDLVVGNTIEHRLDRYANAAGEVRINPTSTSRIGTSWSNYDLYAPESTSVDVTGIWRREQGSPYLTRVSAVRHALPVGTIVTGAGLPTDKTVFLKRVISTSLIEVSERAESSGESEVAFAAFSPKVRQTVNNLTRYNAQPYGFRLMKYAMTDELRFDVKRLESNGGIKNFQFDTVSGYYPGTIVLNDATGAGLDIRLGRCHIEFAGQGVPNGTVKMMSNTAEARLTVPAGNRAILPTFNNAAGALTKDGEGVLAVTFKGAASLTKLAVEEGVLEISEGSGALAVTTLIVKSGATLKVSGNGIKAQQIVAEEGATIAGPGHILNSSITSWPASIFKDGGAIDYVGPSATVYYQEGPATNVVGTPALWMDVSRADTLTYDPSTLRVSALADVRGAGFPVASLDPSAAAPSLVLSASGKPQHIYFAQVGTAGKPREWLKWNVKLTNIRAIFKVLNAKNGGGNLLGSTDTGRLDFWRTEWYSNADRELFTSEATSRQRPSHVTNGVFYVNGERRDWHNGFSYAGGGYSSGKKDDQLVPLLAEYHVPAGGAVADCFSYIPGGTSRTGKERLYEVIVYTNELTQAERLQVAGYLMKKYRLGEVDCSESEPEVTLETLDASSDTAIGVAAGTSVRVKAAEGNGTLVKMGAGNLYVDEYAHADGALRVEGGKLTIRAVKLDSDAAGEGAYIHLDAQNEDSVKLDNGYVDAWHDTRGAGYLTLTNFNANYRGVTVTNNCVNGKRMIDLGKSEGSRGIAKVLAYKACPDLRSVFLVTGTRPWGGALIGHLQHAVKFASGGHLYGLWRRACGCYGTNVAADSLITSAGGYDDKGWLPGWSGPGATRARVNGEYVNPLTQGVTHSGDVVSFVTREDIYGECLSCTIETFGSDTTYYWGAQQLGEYLLFRESLSQEHVRRIEAYLNKKWFGRETVGYRAPQAASVSVAAGATLELAGGETLTVSALSGAGSVDGPLALAANSVFEVPVAPDGSVPTLTVSGTTDLSAGGVVRVTGAVRKLLPGKHPILAAQGLDASVLAGWTLTVDGKTSKTLSLEAKDGKLLLDVRSPGFSLLVR